MHDLSEHHQADTLRAIRQRMQWYIDENIIPCCCYALVKSGHLIDLQCLGYADTDKKIPLAEHAIYRMYSNSKLISSVAAMLLVEEGQLTLDDSIGEFLPMFNHMQVLRKNATDLTHTEPLAKPITLRHLLSHSAGFSYGFVEPDSLIDKAYLSRGLNLLKAYPEGLDHFVAQLAQLPLAFQPGTDWRYSVATDILGHLIEVVSGQTLDSFLRSRVFEPLDMLNTGFCVPSEKRDSVVSLYQAANMFEPMTKGYLNCTHTIALPIDKPPPFLSAGGGLYSTAGDYLNFLQMLSDCGQFAGRQLITSQTLQLMLTDQLAPGVAIKFPMWRMPDTGYGLGFALKYKTNGAVNQLDHYYWGGMAGTHSWVFDDGMIALCMTQLMPSFWHPFSHDFQTLASELRRT
jgi:CubicO group peptidase (beta-lactamase class C family)